MGRPSDRPRLSPAPRFPHLSAAHTQEALGGPQTPRSAAAGAGRVGLFLGKREEEVVRESAGTGLEMVEVGF